MLRRPLSCGLIVSAGLAAQVPYQQHPPRRETPVAMKLDEKNVGKKFVAAGLRLAKNCDFLPHQYLLVFERQ